MEKSERDWILKAATELIAKLTKLTAPFHLDVYDDHAHGRVCSFEMSTSGKMSDFSWNGDVIERAEWPLVVAISDADGERRRGTIRERSWQLEAA